ncbi:MAG: AsmA family protein [Rhizobiaceae bacterium]|nr:MAG: AsmA family protein [Rhizobiaceae bacterium]CAG0996699.1 hypothetical protein RHIZO_02559 [Rhizobiaceae bacterium]
MIVLALTVALVGPYFVDWTSYRADFEREASRILGRKVTVNGAAKARLLPFPSVAFSDVSVAGGTDGEPAMTVETFSMDAELAPFMRGEILIFDMRLERPRMRLSVGPDGVVDWALRPSTPYDPTQISLEKLTVSEGQVLVRHGASGRDHALTEINATISARSLAGPWRAEGTLRLDGVRTTLSVSTGKPDDTGAMRLRVKAEPAVYPFALEADGEIRLEGGAPHYRGQFRLAARNPESGELRGTEGATFQMSATGEKDPPAYRASGDFDLDHRLIDVMAFRLETGPVEDPYTAEGTARIELGAQPRFAITADGAQVRFDDTLTKADAVSGLTLESRLAAIEAVLADLPKPSIPGTIAVKLPAIVAGDTTIRDVALSAQPAPEGWAIESFAALLPGRTTIEGDGLLRTGDRFGFAGKLLLAVGQPSGFAAWLSRDVDEAIRRLPSAGFSARVDLTRERQHFDELELILGDARFHGALDRRRPAKGAASIALELDGGALDVDGLKAFASLFVSDTGMTRLAEQDIDLSLRAGPVSAAGLTAETVDTALRLRDGRIEIDRLALGGLEGASVSATGVVKDLGKTPSGNVDAAIVGADLAPLISILAERYPQNALAAALRRRAEAYPDLFTEAEIDLVASAAPGGNGSVAISAHGKAGGSDFSLTASGTAEPLFDAGRPLSLAVSAKNDNAEALLALYGLPTLPIGMIGGAEATLTARGTLSNGLEAALDFTSEGLSASYTGTFRLAENGAEGEGNISLQSSDIEPWLMTTGLGMPGLGFGTPVDLSADATFGKGLLTFSRIEGSVGEGAVAGDINAALTDGRPHLTGAVTLDTLDLVPVVAMVLGEASLVDGGETWPQTPFAGSAALPLSADLDVSAGTVSAGILGVAEDVSFSGALGAEGLRIADLKAAIHGGALTGLVEIKNNGGTGMISGQAKLEGADIGSLLDGGGINGRADVTATLSASGKTVEGMIAALSGSGTAKAHGLSISGLNAGAFARIIATADEIGRDIDGPRTAAFAPPFVSAGRFDAGEADLAFTVAGGILRAPPLRLAALEATLTASLRADLNAATVAADGEIAYAPGDEALVGSEPSVRFSAEGVPGMMTVRLDTEPLAQFLTQRALEIEQARVEAMQAALLEKQRLRREARYYAALQGERQRLEEERRRAEEEARVRAEEEARARADAEAAAKAEEEARRKAEEEARAKADGEVRLKDEALEKEKAASEARAAEALRRAERERANAAAEQADKIERAPLPSDRGGTVPESSASSFDPMNIENFLKSLAGN